MMKNFKILFVLLVHNTLTIAAFNCHETFKTNEVKYIEWTSLKECLVEFNSEALSSNISENIWRLMKITFDGIENIPVEAYRYLGNTLTALPLDELKNISMERVEVVEAFGAVRTFEQEQNLLIAQKVQNEWIGKNADTYSEYDLISLGGIFCYFNVSVIEQLHVDAFKNAIEWIGNIKTCPQDSLMAFANLAKQAFGEPSNWSKLIVSIIGNIINGLTPSEISSIEAEKLHLNRYYTEKTRNMQSDNINFRNNMNTTNYNKSNKTDAENTTTIN